MGQSDVTHSYHLLQSSSDRTTENEKRIAYAVPEVFFVITGTIVGLVIASAGAFEVKRTGDFFLLLFALLVFGLLLFDAFFFVPAPAATLAF